MIHPIFLFHFIILCPKFIVLLYFEYFFFAAIIAQLIYFLVFVIAFTKKSKTASALSPATAAPLSIVVCAHDELENLQVLIPLLLQQHYPNFEVIVVDDRSNDATRDWLLTETKRHPSLRMVHVDHTPNHINGKKYALTLGIRAAKHDWIVLTDADCRPESANWLNGLSEGISNGTQIILSYSPYQKQAGWLNRFIRFESIITALQYLGFALLKRPYMGVGRNMAYRKSLFMDNKGFTNMLSYTGGDDDLFVNQHAKANNTAVAIGAQTLVSSVPKTTVADFFQQKVRHLAAGKRYKFMDRLLLAPFMLSWVISLILGIALLFLSANPIFIASALFIRLIVMTTTLYVATKRLGDSFELWSVLALDIIYGIYYLTTAPTALLTKKIQWKN